MISILLRVIYTLSFPTMVYIFWWVPCTLLSFLLSQSGCGLLLVPMWLCQYQGINLYDGISVGVIYSNFSICGKHCRLISKGSNMVYFFRPWSGVVSGVIMFGFSLDNADWIKLGIVERTYLGFIVVSSEIYINNTLYGSLYWI